MISLRAKKSHEKSTIFRISGGHFAVAALSLLVVALLADRAFTGLAACPLIPNCSTEYNGPSNGADWVARLALDKDGNVIVGGHHVDGTTKWLIRKFDANCSLIWSKSIDSTYEMGSITTDPDGNIVACGTVGAWNSDMCIIKFDTDGNQEWYKTFATSGIDRAEAVVADDLYIYVAGADNGGASPGDMVVRKLDTVNGAMLKESRPGMKGDLWGAALSPVTGDFIVSGGVDRSGIGESENGLIIAYDANCSTKWVYEFNSSPNSYDGVSSVKVDSEGGIIAAGLVSTTGWLAKFTKNYVLEWTKTREGAQYAEAAIDAGDNIAALGLTQAPNDMLVRQYTADGTYTCEWVQDGYNSTFTDIIRGGVFTNDGGLVVGAHIGTPYGNNWYIAKFPSGDAPEPPPHISPPVGPPGVISNSELYVYPHPLKCPGGYAVFDMPKPGTANMRILSVRGELVKNITVSMPAQDKAAAFIGCEEIRKGAYLLSVALSFYDGTSQVLEPYKFVVAAGK